jgi:hypothetical protein
MVILLLLLFPLFMLLQPSSAAPETSPALEGPVDAAAGAWILYRGEKAEPDLPNPRIFFLKISYHYPGYRAQEGTVLQVKVEESDAQGQPVDSREFVLQTVNRTYSSLQGEERGYWPYWFPPGLDEGSRVKVDDAEAEAVRAEEREMLGRKFHTVTVLGGDAEYTVDRKTGVTLALHREGGESLEAVDTNMFYFHPWWDRLPDYRDVGERLASLAEEFPDYVEVSSLGKSVKGRDIWLVHITDFTSTERKRSLYLDAALEGDAAYTCLFLLDFLDHLFEEERLDRTVELLKKLDIYAVPLVNPDGIMRWLAMPDPSSDPELASQAPRNGNLVAVNRNFDFKWEEGDMNPASPDYGGSAPFSEEESKAVRDLLEDIPASLYVSLHPGPELVVAPWNWDNRAEANPEYNLYRNILSELNAAYSLPTRIGAPVPFTGSSTDWAYSGGAASSPICFNFLLPDPFRDEAAGSPDSSSYDETGTLERYSSAKEGIVHLMANLDSYLEVEIDAADVGSEINVPFDLKVTVKVSGMRPLPNARARLVLVDGSGVKLASLTEKDVPLGDLEPGDSAEAEWKLEGKASGNYLAEVVIESSYPDYDRIPGAFSTQLKITVSAQRTWVVLVLLAGMIVLVVGLVFLSMRKHYRKEKESAD